MKIAFPCPKCQLPVRQEMAAETEQVNCQQCDWSRPVSPEDFANNQPAHCLACGCHDLWRQKDFPPALGLTLVGTGALLSTIAWWMIRPVLAIGILMAFAAIDLILYTLMNDVLVCYRCGARHRNADLNDDHPRFDLEVAERYRQEAIRLSQSVKQNS